MPIYEFECKACGKTFDHLAANMRDQTLKVACPHCHSSNTMRKVSVFAVANVQASGSSQAAGGGEEGGCCCGPNGCGSDN